VPLVRSLVIKTADPMVWDLAKPCNMTLSYMSMFRHMKQLQMTSDALYIALAPGIGHTWLVNGAPAASTKNSIGSVQGTNKTRLSKQDFSGGGQVVETYPYNVQVW